MRREPRDDGSGAGLGKRVVRGRGADVVGVTLDLDGEPRIAGEQRPHALELGDDGRHPGTPEFPGVRHKITVGVGLYF